MAQRRRIVIPNYMQHFRCTGAACPDSCCSAGWRITVDEETYKKYRRCPRQDWRSEFAHKISRNRSNPSPENFAKFKLNRDGSCPFLDADRLCGIQRELGEDYLCDTCAVYPRVYNIIDGVLEKSASLSCPEAARLALPQPGGIIYAEVEEQVGTFIPGRILNQSAPEYAGKPQRFLWDLRTFCIQLLKARDYELWERLLILGLFVQKISEAVAQGCSRQIPAVIDSYVDIVQQGSLREKMATLHTVEAVQLEVLNQVIKTRGFFNKRHQECFQEFLEGVGYAPGAPRDDVLAAYRRASLDYYRPFMREKQYLLENYLVDYLFKNLFPLGSARDLFDNYVMLVVNYALVQMHLIGMAGFHQDGLQEEHVLKLVQALARTMDHSPQYTGRIMDFLRQKGYNTLAYMTVLLKYA